MSTTSWIRGVSIRWHLTEGTHQRCDLARCNPSVDSEMADKVDSGDMRYRKRLHPILDLARRATAAVLLGALLLSCSHSPVSTSSPAPPSAPSTSRTDAPGASVSGGPVTFNVLQEAVVAAGFPGCSGSSSRSNYGADLLQCSTSGKNSLLYLEAADHSAPLQNSLVAFVYGCKQGGAGYRPGPYWVITDKSSFIVFSSSEQVATRLDAALEPLGGHPGTIC
jgi:hypothetical protein